MHQPSFLAASLAVALGGGLGAWLRFLVGRFWVMALGPVRAGAFPYNTLTVNVLGSLAMGLLVGWLARFGSHGELTRLFAAVGVLGGFTTFSSFSLDVISLMERGDVGTASFYVVLSVAAGLIGLWLGLLVMRIGA
ncbi:camphor resistance protein CrcB [Novosphingobium sp. PC22D]|uniref:fluoride efflux transporter CrcB n=1 Tax=Novosphingobium sp. PC22D TaxID=1962403 RepID=UPI000BF00659|nr:fluoride efflux transporter CrcB [Novosphingobium sp. PC22D]PEQ13932.1 camphor resistance protein CrcB [Novosphingobium sp. PC22D]